MRIAVTGTPGCGKTTLCGLLKGRGETVLDVATLASEAGAVAGHDQEDDADVIDVDALAQGGLPVDCYVDGHLSHLLPVDAIWVLRCDPDVLRSRMAARGYSAAKIQENWEAECMDLILQEALETGARVVQRDATGRSPEELLLAFESSSADLEPVDWTDRL